MMVAADTRLSEIFDIYGASHPGRQRSRNEDFWGRCEDMGEVNHALIERFGRLYLVADGVGGNNDGDIASREAVHQAMRIFYNESFAPGLAPAQRLKRAILETSVILARQAAERRTDMATTIVAALLLEETLIVANVGDSRAYLVHASGRITQLTVDHVQNGNELTHAIADLDPEVALHETRLSPGDLVVLCTDGLYNGVREHEISRIVRQNSARQATRSLVNLANRCDGSDNITAIIIRRGPPPRSFGLILRVSGAMVATILGLAVLMNTFTDRGLIPIDQLQQVQGIRRPAGAAFDPTSTLNPIEIKATATTVYVQTQTTRGTVLPTVPPVPPRPTKTRNPVPDRPRNPTATANRVRLPTAEARPVVTAPAGTSPGATTGPTEQISPTSLPVSPTLPAPTEQPTVPAVPTAEPSPVEQPSPNPSPLPEQPTTVPAPTSPAIVLPTNAIPTFALPPADPEPTITPGT